MDKGHDVDALRLENDPYGQTINRTTKEQASPEENERWERIQAHCSKLSAEMLEWDEKGV